MIKTTEMTTHDARRLVQDCFRQTLEEQETAGAFVPVSNEPDMEVREQHVLSQDRLAALNVQIASNQFGGEVRHRVLDLVVRQGFGVQDLPEARMNDLANGVARALVEQQRLFLLRLEDRLAPFEPADSLFRTNIDAGNSVEGLPKFKGPTLGEAVQKYLSSHKEVWKLKTYKARVWQLGYLVEFLGAARPIESIRPDDIRSYRDAILTLRANHGFEPTQTFAAKRTSLAKARIQPKTAELIFQPAKAFFARAVTLDGYIDTSPAQSIKIVVKQDESVVRKRRPFEADEITALFSCPLFVGCKSKARRFEPGDHVFRDGKFWLAILGFYTGCRLGELVQLAIEDIALNDPHPHIDINRKALLGNDEKSVKSGAGLRKVPIHPDLVELGFLKFVAKRAKQDKATVRLFSEIRFGVDGQASTEYSKIFGRLMDHVGLTDPSLVFHSFRHGVEDALRDAGHQQYLIDRIIGHADPTMGGKYGKGVSLEVMSNAVAGMKLPLRLPDLLTSA